MAINSKQERFTNPQDTIAYLLRLVSKANQQLPAYSADTRKRDEALLRFVRSESLLSGVVSSAVSRDKNRGWTLTGGARQVSSYSNKFHSVNYDLGWRQFVSLNATSWYATNFGYASEIGFRYKGGPAETMYHIDPTKCILQDDPKKPINYYPPTKKIPLRRGEFIHGNSMPSVEEKMRRAGFCAVERALEFTRLMIGLSRHHLEKLGVAIPKGIVLGKGITQTEWEQARAMIDAEKEASDREYYEGIMMLFSKNTDADLKLIGLSELPDNFSMSTFIDIIMQGYALAFGYPVGEFWSIASGSFGRTGEMKEQQQQATAKGELDFALSFQEQLQKYFLPESVNFQFDQRNDRGDLVNIEVVEKKFNMINEGVKSTLYDKEEAFKLLAMENIIPADWTETEEDVSTSDLQETRERMLSRPEILRALKYSPSEPIVQYTYNPKFDFAMPVMKTRDLRVASHYEFPVGKVEVLWESGEDAFRKRIY